MWQRSALAVLCGVIAFGCGQSEDASVTNDLSVVPDIAGRRAQFVQRDLVADVTHLSQGDRTALAHLVAAGRAVDEIFKRQAWAGNPELAPLVAGLEGVDGKAAQDYYRIMYGPWDRLTHYEPFLGDSPHPPGAGYYPEDLTRDDFEAWIEAHPEDREAMTSLFTIVRRYGPNGEELRAVPYSTAYAVQIDIAREALIAAAEVTDNESLRRFLRLRAEAFLTNDYYESDMAWMDLDSAIEVVIGPYETYEDQLFGYKAAFESFVCVSQPEDSARLQIFKSELPFLERSLPIPDEYKNFNRGSESPIRVVDEIFTAGDTRAGIQTIAFNLPNDERVREAKGSKKVLLKNVMRAKYDAVLMPIAGRVLPAEGADAVTFEAFFQFTLHHELSHGIGPGQISIDGRETEVRLELKDLYSAFEEAKADVLGVFDIYRLVEKGVMDPVILDSLPWSYTADMFRATRFGVAEAHGLGTVMQANYLLENGAIEITDDGRFQPVPEVFDDAFRGLAHELLMIQALGDYDAGVDFVGRYGTVHPAMAAAIESLTDLPVDIDPSYPLEGLR
jgi:hypothetical protein